MNELVDFEYRKVCTQCIYCCLLLCLIKFIDRVEILRPLFWSSMVLGHVRHQLVWPLHRADASSLDNTWTSAVFDRMGTSKGVSYQCSYFLRVVIKLQNFLDFSRIGRFGKPTFQRVSLKIEITILNCNNFHAKIDQISNNFHAKIDQKSNNFHAKID